VVATDISDGPLKIGEQRARERDLSNIEFVPADVHHLPFADGEFDRVTSRLGVMFFADLPQALREIHRVLKPGGRASLLAWGSMQQPYFETTLGTVLRLLPEITMPASGANMFRFGPAGVLSGLLQEAGFAVVEEKETKVAWNWPGTPEDLWEWFQEVTVPFKPLFAAIPAERREEVNAHVVAELAARYDSREVGFEASIVLASGTR
jgi:SAM-dependent methyltransferase